jgi:hypothetical protein
LVPALADLAGLVLRLNLHCLRLAHELLAEFAMGTQYSAASVIKVAANSYRVIGAVA